jgi:hypothetical protein
VFFSISAKHFYLAIVKEFLGFRWAVIIVPWIVYHHLNLLQEQDSPEVLKDPEQDLERPLDRI